MLQIPCLESWGKRGCPHPSGLAPEMGEVEGGGWWSPVGLRLTCGVMPHHEEEGSVHDDLLGGHSG